MRTWLIQLLRALAVRGYDRPYAHSYRPGGLAWAQMLRERGDFYAMGDNCYIEPSALSPTAPTSGSATMAG